MTSSGKFVYMVHYFILLRLTLSGLGVDREGWWFDHSVSQLPVCLLAEGTKNVSGPWLSFLRGWATLIMTSAVKFLYMAHHFILLQLNPFGLRVDKERW